MKCTLKIIYPVFICKNSLNNAWPNGFAGLWMCCLILLQPTKVLRKKNKREVRCVCVYIYMWMYIHLLGVSTLTHPLISFTPLGYPDGAGPANCACFLCLRNNETSPRHHLYQQMHEAGTQLNQFEHENWTLKRTINPIDANNMYKCIVLIIIPSIIWYYM